jgi:hypothetical protein
MAKQNPKSRARNRGTHRKPPRSRDTALDDRAREILQLTALLLARCDYSRTEMQRHFEQAIASIPEWVGAPGGDQRVSNHIVGEVLTRWHLLPRYSLHGRPRPLPAEGRLSLTSLIRSITRRVDPHHIRDQLISAQSVSFENGMYLPAERALRVRHDPRLLSRHHVRIVRQLLRTVEGNARRQEDLRRFEFITTGIIPRAVFADFVAAQGKSALNFLFDVDREFLSHSVAPIPRSDQIEMSVGVIFSDDRPLPPLTAPANLPGEETGG